MTAELLNSSQPFLCRSLFSMICTAVAYFVIFAFPVSLQEEIWGINLNKADTLCCQQ